MYKVKISVLTIFVLFLGFVNTCGKDFELKNGKTITQNITIKDIHNYSLNLNKGQLVLLDVKEKNINVEMTVKNSEGLKIEKSNTSEVADILIFYAKEKGKYSLDIKPYDYEDKTKGNYTLETNMYTSKNGSKVEVIDRLLSKLYHKNFPGSSVTILDKGKVVYKKSFGLASIEHNTPNTSKTLYDLASVSKQFTAYGIAMLADKKLIKLDDDIRKYIPELPKYKQKVTIRHLIHHTSGLPDTGNQLNLAGFDNDNSYIPDDLDLRILKRQKNLLFKPGEKYQYSNVGYLLMGEIIKRVTGKPFSVWAKENIFSPLKMNDTFVRDKINYVSKNQSTSYIRYNSKVSYIRQPVNFTSTGACCIRSSTEDMLKWIDNLKTGKIGGKKVLQMIDQIGLLNSGKSTEYAFGNFHTTHKGLKRISHLGLTAGFRTSLVSFPDQDISFIYLANDGEWKTYYIARKLYDIYLADYLEKPKKEIEKKEISNETETPKKKVEKRDIFNNKAVKLSKFTGVFYASEIVTAYEIKVRKGKLYIESISYKPILLEPVKKDVFKGDEDFFERVEFVKNKKNKIVGFKAFDDEGSPSVYFEKVKDW